MDGFTYCPRFSRPSAYSEKTQGSRASANENTANSKYVSDVKYSGSNIILPILYKYYVDLPKFMLL